MKEKIINIPKVELHLHLDGSVRTSTANELLNRDVTKEMKVDSEVTNLNEYLEKFDIPVELMQTKENIERISEELATDLKQENVIYAEIRFAPLKHLEQGLTPEEVIESVLNGLSKVDIKTNVILCAIRGESYEENKKVVDLASKYLNKGVCAIDLAGAEALYKTKEYKDLFEYANQLNVPFTIHAGEADGIESIESALSFGTKRLGHGVRTLENKETLEKIINNNITLEVCPTSNINTSIFPEYKMHNIKALYELGVKVTINTDNRTVSNITISEEYEKLQQAFNFTYNDFYNMNLNAINASFITESEKEQLRKILKESYSKYE